MSTTLTVRLAAAFNMQHQYARCTVRTQCGSVGPHTGRNLVESVHRIKLVAVLKWDRELGTEHDCDLGRCAAVGKLLEDLAHRERFSVVRHDDDRTNDDEPNTNDDSTIDDTTIDDSTIDDSTIDDQPTGYNSPNRFLSGRSDRAGNFGGCTRSVVHSPCRAIGVICRVA